MSERSLSQTVRALPRAAWVLYAGTFLNKFGNFLNVFLVLYLTQNGYSVTEAGFALGLVGLGNAVGNALGGVVADRIGRRFALSLSMFGSAIFTASVPFVHGYIGVVSVVTAVGVFAQLYRPAAGALLLDVVEEESRVTAFAVYRLAINVGMAAGPAVGGFIAMTSFNWIFFGDAISSAAYGLLVLALLPETTSAKTRAEARHGRGYKQVLGDRRFLLFLLAMVGATFVYIQSTATLPLHIHDHGMSSTIYGFMLALNALLVVVFELPLTHALARRSPTIVIPLGLVLLGGGFALTAAATSIPLLVVSVLAWTVAEMVYASLSNAHPGRFAPDSLRGRYQAAYGFAHTAGATLGPAVCGLIYAASPSAVWLLCGAVGLGSAALVFAARPRAMRVGDAEPVREQEAVAAATTPRVQGDRSGQTRQHRRVQPDDSAGGSKLTPMNQLKGSLRFIPLPTVTQLLAGLGSTGRLRIRQGTFQGDIALHDGQVVAAQLGPEHGRSALEGMVLALADAEFDFVDEPVEHDGEALLAREQLAGYLASLAAERERLQPLTSALDYVPCLVEDPQTGSETAQVTIEVAALQLIPSLIYGYTLEQLAHRRGLARTLREVVMLQSGGLVRLEPAPPARRVGPASAPVAPQPVVQEIVAPLPVPQQAQLPVRSPQPAASGPPPAVAQLHAGTPWRQALVSRPTAHNEPRLRVLPQQSWAHAKPVHDDAAASPSPRLHLSPPISETVAAEEQDVSLTSSAGRARGWRGALVDFFIAQTR